MPPGLATVARKLLHGGGVSLAFRKTRGQLIAYVPQAMNLLAHDLTCDPAGILHVLVAVEDFRHRCRLGAKWIPQMRTILYIRTPTICFAALNFEIRPIFVTPIAAFSTGGDDFRKCRLASSVMIAGYGRLPRLLACARKSPAIGAVRWT